MSFELIEELLAEDVEKVEELIEGEEVDDTEDDGFFDDMDDLVEVAMRASVRDTIMESGGTDEEKVALLEAVEDKEFTDEQMLTFMSEMITPVLDIAGYLEESVYVEEEMIEVPLTVALVTNIVENVQLELQTEDEAFEDLTGIFESFGIEEEEQDALIDLAEGILEDVDSLSLSPSISDVVEVVYEWNLLAEEYDLKSASEILAEGGMGTIKDALKKGRDKAGEKVEAAKTAGGKVKDAIMSKIAAFKSDKSDKIKNKGPVPPGGRKEAFKNATTKIASGLSSVGSKIKDATPGQKVVVGLSAAAVAAAGYMSYKKFKSRACAGLSGSAKSKCMAGAADQAIAAARKTNCSGSKNPAKCQKSVMKEVKKWEAKKAKHMAAAAGA